MQAIVLEQPRQFRIHQVQEPEPPGPGEALVRVHRVGICGTDIAGYLGKFPFYAYPRIPGHELGVEIVALGPGVDQLQPGQRCAVEPYMNDPTSFASRRGRPNCCERLQVLGVHVDGGLRPLIRIPARKLHPSDSLSLEQLALVETLSIGCHAVDRAAPQAGEHVLVVGAGPIGLSVMEFARLADVQLTVMDMNPQRLAFCRDTMGVQHTVLYRGDGSELADLREITAGQLPTVVIDATGNAASMAGSFQYVAHTGKLVFVGIITGEVCFPDPLFHAREITLLASRNSLPTDFRRIIQLIERGTIDTRPWITHRLTFDQVVEEFDRFTRPETGAIKAVIEVNP
jgi:alcohol dehydrogenase